MADRRDSGIAVHEPGSAGWERARRLFDASLDRRPGRVYQPGSVARAAELAGRLQQEARPFTVKSGGHSAAGLSVTDGVPVVDLSRLRAVRVDPDRSVAVIEGGALMADLDTSTVPRGLATTGGTVSHTGVVGLAIGGGLGWLMGRFGLVCDNIVEASVVESGRLSVIREPSALMALRGTGVVTELTLRVHPIEPAFSWLTLMLAPDRIVDAFLLLDAQVSTLPEQLGCALTISGDPAGTVTGTLDFVGPRRDPGIADWLGTMAALPGERVETVMSYREVQRALDHDFPFGHRSYRRSSCLDDLDESYLADLVTELTGASGYHRTVTFDILHGPALSDANAANTGFPRHRYVGLLVCRWSTPQLDLAGREAGRDMFRQITAAHATADQGVYGNYSSEPADSAVGTFW
jgi:hypothetical protein